MLNQINVEMLIAFTILLTFHGSIFLKLAKNVFITKKEHEDLSNKMDARLFLSNGMPIYTHSAECNRRQVDRDRIRTEHLDRMCRKIEELRMEVKELREILLDKAPSLDS